jgi:hypothetical protein
MDTDGATLEPFEARREATARELTGECRWRIASRLSLCCPASGGGRRRFSLGPPTFIVLAAQVYCLAGGLNGFIVITIP